MDFFQRTEQPNYLAEVVRLYLLPASEVHGYSTIVQGSGISGFGFCLLQRAECLGSLKDNKGARMKFHHVAITLSNAGFHHLNKAQCALHRVVLLLVHDYNASVPS
eukprot:1145932-Pelagomonas_calceolata.AAC.5